MAKIPVSRTIAYAYRFTFGHLGVIIGLIWLPMVIVAVAGYFVMANYYGTFPSAIEQGNFSAIGQSVAIVLVWSIASLQPWAMMYAAVTRQAMGLRQGPALVSFSFGATELRLFGAMVALIAIFFFFLLAYIMVMGQAASIVAGLSAGAQQIADQAAGLFSILFIVGMIYSFVRMSFLMVPATVAEGKIGLASGWQLAKGNFWRIFVIGLATLGPLVLVLLVAETVIFGPDFVMPKGPAPVDLDAQMRQMAAQMRAMAPHLPVLYGFLFFMAPISLGLALAPAAFAYRALTQPQAPALQP